MSRGRSRIVTMGFPDRGEENLMRQTSKCKNFQPNMFNKTKCQNCFRTREAHDLGDDDGSNKPKKALQYGYLFVAPGIDFDNPMARTRKWQRRCFILYENGELCYSLDFDPNAIPQGVVNMYECTKVFNSDDLTGHQFSMGIATTDETTYIRAESREEKDRWYETLVEYPEINKENAKQKKKKRGIFPMIGQKDSENSQKIEDQAEAKPDLPSGDDDPLSDDLLLESRDEVGPVENTTARDTTDIHTATSKAARKEKSNLRRSHSALEQRPDKYEKKTPVRRTPSAQPVMTSSTSETMSPRIGRRHTMAVGEVQDDSAMSGKGDASRRPSDGSGYKYSSSSSIRSRQSESGLVDLERELKNKDDVFRSHRESLPAQAGGAETSLHRNNNNVYKDVSPRLSPTQHPTTSSSSRKSSLGDANTTETDSHQSTTDSSQTKKSQPSKTDTTNAQNMLSQEELQRMDVPKRGRMRTNKSLIDGETQSPSKRTIERRRHAQDRRNRHTLDGSTVPFPISERKDKSEGGPRLKRSNSDPNLADTEEVKRKEIAETFPGLLHLKNGWLMMQDPGQEDWNKYWFVLRDNKLSYFKDSSDENPSNLAGAVDLALCQEAAETTASRNYGFQVKMADDSAHKLGAMTSGIRTNWIQAINKAIATARKEASPEAEPPLKKPEAPLKEPEDVVQVVDSAPVLSEPSPLQEQTSSVAPDVIPTPLPRQNSLDPARSSLSIDLTSRHRKNSMDSRRSESSSPTEKDPPVFHERQGSIRSKERRSRRSSKSTEESTQKPITTTKLSSSSINDRSSSTSSEAFETPPNTPTPIELRIEEPLRRTSTSSTRSERVEEQIQVHKIEADSLKPQTDQQDMDVMALDSLQQRSSIGGVYSKQSALDNENEQKALVSQLETVVKKLSQVELQNQTLHMEVKQARNASELLKHEKEDLHDKLQNSNGVLEKRARECETLQSRFEKLVTDYQESEKEVSKARTSLKAERDKAVTMIERLNDQMEVLEGEKGEIKERAKKHESELGMQKKQIRLMEKNQEESEKVLHKLLEKLDEYKHRLDAKGDDGSSSTKEVLEANMQLQARLQEVEQQLALKENVDSQRAPLDNEQDAEELADLRMELSERDEQIEQLSEQLEAEFDAKSDLQSKYDSLVAKSAQIVLEAPSDATYAELEKKLMSTVANLENLKEQLTYETAQRKQTEDKLSQEMSEKGRLAEDLKELEGRLQNAMEGSQEASQAQEDTRNLMQLLQVKNKEVEKMQTEIKRIEADRVSLMQQSGNVTAEIEEVKRQLKDSEEAKNTLEGDMECVLQSKLDLEEAAKQTATELVTVKSELDLLRKTSQDATSSAEEVSRRDAERQEAAQKEVQLLQAKVDKVQEMYTEDMFKKEKLLAEENEKLAEMERKFASLQGKLTKKEEELTQKEKESGEKVQEVTKQLEQLSQKVEREERDLKRLRTELKTSQDSYDALELKHMQTTEESKQQQKSQQEQLELMGLRIQDLTNKLGTAERKVRDLTSAEARWNSFGGGGSSGINSGSGVHLGTVSGAGTGALNSYQSSGLHSQLMEVEQVLGSAESHIKHQHEKANALEGKIELVEKHMEAIEQAEPASSLSSFDHDVSVNSCSSPTCPSSINQIADAPASVAKTTDTSDCSDSPSTDGADEGTSQIKVLESRLAEMETKLRKVTHRLVDVTTRELEKRKAFQAKCVTENKLKDQVRGLQREVLALRQQMEKVQSHSESAARQTHSVLSQCRQHLMRIQHPPTTPKVLHPPPMEHGATDTGLSKGSTNTVANPSDKHVTVVTSTAAASHVVDACHTLDRALEILVSQLKTLETRKRKSLTEFSESVILGLSGDFHFFSDSDNPRSPLSCPTSPLFFPTSPPQSPEISPRSQSQSARNSEIRLGQLIRFPGKSTPGSDSPSVDSEKLQKLRYSHCLLEVEYLNSFLEDVSGSAAGSEDEIGKLLSCYRMIEAEDREGSMEKAQGREHSDAESEFLAMKEPEEPSPVVVGPNEISMVYAACTAFFTNHWEFSHSLEKQLEENCDALARVLAEETHYKEERPSDSKKAQQKPEGKASSNRLSGKNDSGLGFDSDLAPFAEGIAYEEALRVAMECVSSELVLAEALQNVNSTIEDFVGKIDAEEQKCKRVLTALKPVCVHRFNLIREAIARQLEATSGLIRQKYWDYLQDSEGEIHEPLEESTKKRKRSKKSCTESQRCATGKGVVEDEREGFLEKEIAVLVLMKAVLSGLVVHLRNELSLLAEGNSNQNNNGGLPFDLPADLVLPSSHMDPFDQKSMIMTEQDGAGLVMGWEQKEHPKNRLSVLEILTSEHSKNITMIRERYEAIIKGERSVHQQELIELRQRLENAEATVKKLERDFHAASEATTRKHVADVGSNTDVVSEMTDEALVEKDETDVSLERRGRGMGSGSESLSVGNWNGQREIREAKQQLTSIRSEILQMTEYHQDKLRQMAEGIQAIDRCYQDDLSLQQQVLEKRISEAENRAQMKLAEAHQRYQRGIAEMQLHHEAQTKRLVKEAKEQQSDELVQTQQRLHQEALEKLQESHRKELENLTKEHTKEKEQEDDAVTTTISALKRAFEEDVEKERKMSQESYPKDVETIMKRHREVTTQMNRDWRILSQKFSEQCRENTLLSKALRAMQRSQKEAHEKLQQAQVENRQRVDRLGEQLARMEEEEEEDEDEEEDEEEDEDIDEEELRKLKMHLRLRELELEFAREEINSLRQTQLGGGEKGASGGASRDEKEGAGDKSRHGSLIPVVETVSDAATRPKTRRSLSDLTQKFYKSKKGEKK